LNRQEQDRREKVAKYLDLYAKHHMSKQSSLSTVYKQADQPLNLKEELIKKNEGNGILEPELKNSLTSKQRDDVIMSK